MEKYSKYTYIGPQVTTSITSCTGINALAAKAKYLYGLISQGTLKIQPDEFREDDLNDPNTVCKLVALKYFPLSIEKSGQVKISTETIMDKVKRMLELKGALTTKDWIDVYNFKESTFLIYVFGLFVESLNEYLENKSNDAMQCMKINLYALQYCVYTDEQLTENPRVYDAPVEKIIGNGNETKVVPE